MDHPPARRPGITLDDVAGCQLLMHEPGSIARRVIEDMFTTAGIESASTSIIGNRGVIYETINRGLGCSIVPIREAPHRPDVHTLPFSGNAPVIHEYLYLLKGREDARLVRALLGCLDPWRAPAPTKKTDTLAAKVMAMDTTTTCQGRSFVAFQPPLSVHCIQSLALFDLDHTLLPTDSEYGWGRFLITQGTVDRNEFEQANGCQMREYRDDMLDFTQHARFSFGLLAQYPRTRFDAWRATFVRGVITPAMLPSARRLADTYLRAGDLCYTVTATHHYLAKPVAVAPNMPHLPAVGGETFNGQSDGTFTSNLLSMATSGAGKIVCVTEWLTQHGQRMTDFTRTVFYSNSRSDLPLLEAVSHPMAVSPDSTLCAVAESCGQLIAELFPA